MTEERAAKQRELLTPHLAASDAVITTAAVPGRRAPLLVDRRMVEAMRPGTVIVDIAAESGGNVELSKPGEEVLHNGVLIWGGRNVPSGMPYDASRLYARNLANLLVMLTRDGEVVLDLSDEIVAASLVVHEGQVRT
jgi:NAD(P) transhydrogenase subunit alpha